VKAGKCLIMKVVISNRITYMLVLKYKMAQ